jgi:hypothetical protein
MRAKAAAAETPWPRTRRDYLPLPRPPVFTPLAADEPDPPEMTLTSLLGRDPDNALRFHNLSKWPPPKQLEETVARLPHLGEQPDRTPLVLRWTLDTIAKRPDTMVHNGAVRYIVNVLGNSIGQDYTRRGQPVPDRAELDRQALDLMQRTVKDAEPRPKQGHPVTAIGSTHPDTDATQEPEIRDAETQDQIAQNSPGEERSTPEFAVSYDAVQPPEEVGITTEQTVVNPVPSPAAPRPPLTTPPNSPAQSSAPSQAARPVPEQWPPPKPSEDAFARIPPLKDPVKAPLWRPEELPPQQAKAEIHRAEQGIDAFDPEDGDRGRPRLSGKLDYRTELLSDLDSLLRQDPSVMAEEERNRKAANILLKGAEKYNESQGGKLAEWAGDRDVTPKQLGYQWATGTGPTFRFFDENSHMGKKLVKATYMQANIDSVVQEAYATGKTVSKPFAWSLDRMIHGSRKLSTAAYPPYFFSHLLCGNDAEALHGSLRYTITVEPPTFPQGARPWTEGRARVRVQAQDDLSAISGTRLPPILGGYADSKAVFTRNDPLGPNAPFRTIHTAYDMSFERPFTPLKTSLSQAARELPPTILPGPIGLPPLPFPLPSPSGREVSPKEKDSPP